MSYMSKEVRLRIIEAAKASGFRVQLKPDGNDLYNKNLVFQSPMYPSPVFVHTETGVSKVSGNFSYLKVAVRPDVFKGDLIDPVTGVEDYISLQSKENRHHSSNYVGFPDGIAGKVEPYGKCYRVTNLDAFAALLKGLSGETR